MSKKHKEESMADLAAKSLSQISELLEDDKPISRLLALNSILVFLILGLAIGSFLNVKFDDFSGIVILLIAFLFSAIISGAYIFFIKLFSKAYKINAMRVSIFILFIAIPLSVLGLAYRIKPLINIALVLILIQALLMIILSLFIREEQISEEKSDIWEILGKAGIILGIISSLITIGGLAFKFLS